MRARAVGNSAVVRVCAGGVVGHVADLENCWYLLDQCGLHAFEHCHLAHRATVATATHREIRNAFTVVTDESNEAAV